MAQTNYLSITLPINWGPIFQYEDPFTSVLLQRDENNLGLIDVGNSVTIKTGRTVLIKVIDNEETDLPEYFIEGKNYFLKFKNLMTPETSKIVDLSLGTIVLSIGETSKGGLGWSSEQQWRYNQPVFNISNGKIPLNFDKDLVYIKRGTFSGEVCINVGLTVSNVAKSFEYVVGFEIKKAGFEIYNTRINSKIGEEKTCGLIGVNQQM